MSRKMRRWVVIAVVGVLLAAGAVWGITALSDAPGAATKVYEINGIEFTSSVEITEEATGVYLYLPVNADMAEVVVSTPDPEFTAALREQLDELDTFVPGEHVLELPDMTVHVIVDGIEE